MSKIGRARLFQIAAHSAVGQERANGTPYWMHPEAVAQYVEEVTDDIDVIVAAYLHDVVEDTQVKFSTIESLFGPRVRQLVYEVTNIALPEDGNRKKRVEINRLHLMEASPEGMTIKLADMKHNLNDVAAKGHAFAMVYMEEKKQLLPHLKNGDPRLYRDVETIIAQFNDA